MVHLHLLPLTDAVRAVYQSHDHFHAGDCGLDLFVVQEQTIGPGETATIPLAIKTAAFEIKPSAAAAGGGGGDCASCSVGWLLFPRSSISKTPLRLCNSVGLIDAGYRGEVKVVVDNVKTVAHTVKPGDRLVQAVAFDGKAVSFEVVDQLDENTARGEGGFGSTTKSTNNGQGKENVGVAGGGGAAGKLDEGGESKKQKVDVS
eukprot:GHVS01037081.1.p1 GENE.GHVS01037081.1~~GHVS01037081.1.p1  ORF type:complete len:203 (+),score=46.62 GHVS01037081.1:345-953(+)